MKHVVYGPSEVYCPQVLPTNPDDMTPAGLGVITTTICKAP